MFFFRWLVVLSGLTLIRGVVSLCPAVKKCILTDTCGLLPVPTKSVAPPVGPAGYELKLLRPGVYSWTDGTYYTLIIYVNRRLLLVDVPGFMTAFRGDEYLLNTGTMDVLGNERPTRLDIVYSHRHIDHIGGAAIFLSFVQKRFPGLKTFVWGTEETRNFLVQNEDSKIPKPNVIIRKNGASIKLEKSLSLNFVVLGGHTDSDVAVHVLPNRRGPGIMYFADFVIPGFVPFFDFSLTTNLLSYIKAQEALLKFDFEIFVPGHWNLGTKQDIFQNLRYTRDVIKFRREAAADVTPQQLAASGFGRIGDPQALEFGNRPLAVKLLLDLQSKICVRKLIRKYGCELGAADLFAPSHCKTAFFFDIFDVESVQFKPGNMF